MKEHNSWLAFISLPTDLFCSSYCILVQPLKFEFLPAIVQDILLYYRLREISRLKLGWFLMVHWRKVNVQWYIFIASLGINTVLMSLMGTYKHYIHQESSTEKRVQKSPNLYYKIQFLTFHYSFWTNSISVVFGQATCDRNSS